MTEFWKSHAMHWCDVCKCWLNDTKAARQHHEAGMGHKANLAKKLRDMGKKADEEKRSKEAAEAAMKRIEKQAQDKFAADKAEADRAAAHEAARNGRWVWDESCSYYYNEVHRWYYDPKTKWYYGGDGPTPEWIQVPPLPAAAKFGTAPHDGGPVPQPTPAQLPGSAAAGPSRQGAAGPAAGSVKKQQVVVALPAHPQQSIGGYQAPTSLGRVGAAKGIGLVNAPQPAKPGAGSKAAGAASEKRKREEEPLSKEEQAARDKREAARARVAARTAQNFGYM